jgi:hypothetical protein
MAPCPPLQLALRFIVELADHELSHGTWMIS